MSESKYSRFSQNLIPPLSFTYKSVSLHTTSSIVLHVFVVGLSVGTIAETESFDGGLVDTGAGDDWDGAIGADAGGKVASFAGIPSSVTFLYSIIPSTTWMIPLQLSISVSMISGLSNMEFPFPF